MKKFSKTHTGSLNELNITPLLDLVIVLLMIFILAAPQLTNELELSLPSSQPEPQEATNTPPEITFIAVASTGAVTLNQKPCPMDSLKPLLVAMHRQKPDMNVVISGHEDAEYEKVIAVLDLLQQAEITNIGLATETGLSSPAIQ